MSSSNYSINHNAVAALAGEGVAVGNAVLKTATGYLVATLANRTAQDRRCDGVALEIAAAGRAFKIAHDGLIDEVHSGLPDGDSGDWVIVADDGTLERTAAPAVDDDIIGKCPGTNGDFHLNPGSSADGGGNVPEGDEDDAVALDGDGGFKAIGPVVVLPDGLTAGDIIYWNGTAFARLPIGGAGQILTVTGGLPAWEDAPEGTAYDISALELAIWLSDNFTGAPWVGKASAGTSDTIDATEATNPPATGAALDGYTPADGDGSNDQLEFPGTRGDYDGAGNEWSCTIMYSLDSAAAPAGNTYENAHLIGCNSDELGIIVSSSGVKVVQHDGAFKQCPAASWLTAPTAAYHVVQAKYDGTTLSCRVDGGARSTTLAGAPSANSVMRLFRGGGASAYTNGQIKEVIWAPSALDDADEDGIYSALKTKYPTAALP